jgi:anti-sigma-K factor RskA
MADDLTPAEARDALAAELALGLLEGDARAEALRLRLADPGFAAQVASWESKFAALHDETAPVAPSDGVWDAVAARLPEDRSRAVVVLETRLNRWRMAAAGSGAVAAALALVLVTQSPAPLPAPAAAQIAVARIEGAAAGPLVRARYDRGSGVMDLGIEGFTPGDRAPELWVIPAGGAPVSLGQVAPSGAASVTVPSGHRALVQDGATLAITMEPVSATPHAAPSSAPVAAGKITFL